MHLRVSTVPPTSGRQVYPCLAVDVEVDSPHYYLIHDDLVTGWAGELVGKRSDRRHIIIVE